MLNLINIQLAALKRAAIKASQLTIMSGIGLGIGSAIFFNLLRRFVRPEEATALPPEESTALPSEETTVLPPERESGTEDVESSHPVEIPGGDVDERVLSTPSSPSVSSETFVSLSQASTSSSETDSFLSAASSCHDVVDAHVSEIQVKSLPELLLPENSDAGSSILNDTNPRLTIKDSHVVMVMQRKPAKEVAGETSNQRTESWMLSRSDGVLASEFVDIGCRAEKTGDYEAEYCIRGNSLLDVTLPGSLFNPSDVPRRRPMKFELHNRRRCRSCPERMIASLEATSESSVGSPERDDVEDACEENWTSVRSRESIRLSPDSPEKGRSCGLNFHRVVSSISENDLSSLSSSGSTSGDSSIKGSISYNTTNPTFVQDVWSFSIATNSGCSSILGTSSLFQQSKTGSEVVDKMTAIEAKLRLVEKEAMEVKRTFEKIRKSEAGVAKLCFVAESDDVEFCGVDDEKSFGIDSSRFCHDLSSLTSPRPFSDVRKDHDNSDLSMSLNRACPVKRQRTSTPQVRPMKNDRSSLHGVFSDSCDATRTTKLVLLDEDVQIGSTTFRDALDWNFEDVLGSPADASISF